MWIEHHRIFRYIRQYNAGLMWRNLIFLMTISFMPFPTAVFSEYFWSRTAFMLYAASFAGVALTKLWVWRYTIRQGNLMEEGIEEIALRRISRRSLAVPIGCGAAIILSLFSVLVAPIGFILIPVVARLLDPTRNRKDRQPVQIAKTMAQKQ